MRSRVSLEPSCFSTPPPQVGGGQGSQNVCVGGVEGVGQEKQGLKVSVEGE